MPKGSNPNSHFNKPTIAGLVTSRLNLTKTQWAFLKLIGRGNQSRGAREMVKALEIIAQENWCNAFNVLLLKEHVIGTYSSPEQLSSLLLQYIPDLKLGVKNQDDLVQELALGECNLVLDKYNRIRRVVNLVNVEVSNKGKQLVEVYQELASGKRIGRNYKHIAEKIQYPEDSRAAAYRALREELGVVPKTLCFVRNEVTANPYTKYKGIESFSQIHLYRATLNPEDIKSEYVEEDDEKRTVFEWQDI